MDEVTIVGAGLAGTECAWQLAERGVPVVLIEQKPLARTPAQNSDGLAELVCSNSFRGAALHNAVGLLKEEMRRAGSLMMSCAEVARVPAGGAFAVDRDLFSAEVTRRIGEHKNIELRSQIVESIPEARPLVLATGPLTGDALAADLSRVIGTEYLAYYDAIAPVVSAESLDWDKVYKANRYDKGDDAAYVNCPMDKEQYEAFVDALVTSDKVVAHDFEEVGCFEGCLPVEVMASRGVQTLAFGPMKPVGLIDPRTGQIAHAVVQLRQENKAGTAYNLVGFQTRMTWPEQKRVFGMIPGLENAHFERLGMIHRNTYVDSPRVLDGDLSLRALPGVHLAGQICGVEGYVESAACGLLLGLSLAAKASGEDYTLPPETTALGGLYRHLQDQESKKFTPSNVIFGMFPKLPGRKMKRRYRREGMAKRALLTLDPWLETNAVGRGAEVALRVEAERVEAERLEAERLEAERVEAERVEAERLEAERVEAERVEAERVEAEPPEALPSEQQDSP